MQVTGVKNVLTILSCSNRGNELGGIRPSGPNCFLPPREAEVPKSIQVARSETGHSAASLNLTLHNSHVLANAVTTLLSPTISVLFGLFYSAANS
jgi:hypothetical protein